MSALLIAQNEASPTELWDLEVLGRWLGPGGDAHLLGGRPTGVLHPALRTVALPDDGPTPRGSLARLEERLGLPIAREIQLLERVGPALVLTSSRLATMIAARWLGIPVCVRIPAFHHPASHAPPVRVRPDLDEGQRGPAFPLRWRRALLARSWRQARTLVRRMRCAARELRLEPSTSDLVFGLGDLAILREPPECLPEALDPADPRTVAVGPDLGWETVDGSAPSLPRTDARTILMHVASDHRLADALERALRPLRPRWELAWLAPPAGYRTDLPVRDRPWEGATWEDVGCAVFESRDVLLWQAWRRRVPVIGMYRQWPERAALEDLARTGTAVFFHARRLNDRRWEELLAPEFLEPAHRAFATRAPVDDEAPERLRRAVAALRAS